MTRARLLPLAVLLALAPAPARADTTPLSALPDKPARYAQADGRIPATATPNRADYEVRAAGSACLVNDPPQYWIDGDASHGDRDTVLEFSPSATFGIERFALRGDTPELERVTVSLIYGELVPSARSRITLHAVAKLDGLVVYAYRWGAHVFLLARSSGEPLRRRDGGLGLEEATGCGVAYTTLRVRDGASQPVQIIGTIPGTGKRYLVGASVAQTGRDPEPLLSVTARLLEK
jgi:hypothetical protein